MKLDIVLDFDETLFGTSSQMRRFLNQFLGIEIPTEGYLCGHSLHTIAMDHLPPGSNLEEGELYEALGRDFLASMVWHEDVKPIDGVTEIIPELAKRYNLHIATARQTTSKAVVDALLDRFLPQCISTKHFVWTHVGNREFKSVPKKDFVRGLLQPFAYVDDNPKETSVIVGVAHNVILFDPDGHHAEVADETHRLMSWEQIGNLLL